MKIAPDTLDVTSKIQRSPDVLITELDNEIVVLHVSSGQIIGMSDTSRRIWDALEHPSSLDDLTDQLVEEYDIDREICLSETTAFVASLLAADFAALVDE